MNISSTEREQQKVAWLQSLHDSPEEQNCVGVRGESTLQNTMVLSRSTRSAWVTEQDVLVWVHKS